jgi:DNA-binding response OmpR family regulator
MTDKAPKSSAVRPEDDLDLTRSIRMLAMPTKPADADEDRNAESRTVLIACRDSASRKWGPKWLRQAGLEATLVSEPDEALSVARSTSPGVIIVEAGLRDQSGARLFEIFQNAADLTVPVIVLCANTKDVKAALDAGVFDVVRKPIEWHLVSRRAKSASKIGSSEAQLRQSQGPIAHASICVAGNRLSPLPACRTSRSLSTCSVAE